MLRIVRTQFPYYRLVNSKKEERYDILVTSKELNSLSPDIILGAAVGGILLSRVVAQQFGTKGIFAERVQGDMILKRDFDIKKNSKVLIVEDIVTTGGSIDELIEIVENKNAILYLQPEWGKREEMMPLMVDFIKKNPKWKISLQTHKYLNIP